MEQSNKYGTWGFLRWLSFSLVQFPGKSSLFFSCQHSFWIISGSSQRPGCTTSLCIAVVAHSFCHLFRVYSLGRLSLWHIVLFNIWGAKFVLLLLTFLFQVWHHYGGTRERNLLDVCLTFQENLRPMFCYTDCAPELFFELHWGVYRKLHQFIIKVLIKPWLYLRHVKIWKRCLVFAAWLEGTTKLLSEICPFNATLLIFSLSKGQERSSLPQEPEKSSFGNILLLGKALYSLVYPWALHSAPGLDAHLE